MTGCSVSWNGGFGDRRVLRLIRKWLTVGVLENGVRTPAMMGTPQGAVITP